MKVFDFYFSVCLIVLLLSPVYCRKQNVLLLMLDDFRPAIKSLGDDNAVTPNIDRIVASSHVFTNAYAQVEYF